MPASVITPSQLGSRLWAAVKSLRGPLRPTDFKACVFPLLFFKHLSDVHDEACAGAVAETSDNPESAEFPQDNRFRIPDGCHWNDVRAVASEVGQALQHAMGGIEQANPQVLDGIFGDAAWANQDRLPDALLRQLLEHYSRINLGHQAAPASTLGEACEDLIKRFADGTRKNAGEFYTPRSLVKLLVRLLDPKPGEAIYDPACGTGGLLLEASHHVQASHSGNRRRWGNLFGQEKNLTTSVIARIDLVLHGAAGFQIVRGDTLREPAFVTGDHLATFDCVLANPPFSLENWGDEVWKRDPFGRPFAGMPPARRGDYAWVQHMVRSMAAPSGRMAVVLPQGALFRMGQEGVIREQLLRQDLLEAVIGLGPNLLYGTRLAACLLIFRRRKRPGRQHKVLFVDASREFQPGRSQNELLPEHVERIHQWYRRYEDVTGIARVVTLEEITAHDFHLNISRYIEPEHEPQVLTVKVAIQQVLASARAASAAEEALLGVCRREELLQ